MGDQCELCLVTTNILHITCLYCNATYKRCYRCQETCKSYIEILSKITTYDFDKFCSKRCENIYKIIPIIE